MDNVKLLIELAGMAGAALTVIVKLTRHLTRIEDRVSRLEEIVTGTGRWQKSPQAPK